jgi:hypothetical protein
VRRRTLLFLAVGRLLAAVGGLLAAENVLVVSVGTSRRRRSRSGLTSHCDC